MAKQPDPWRSLTGEIVALKAKLADLARRSPFFGTGMHPNGENGLDSDNFVADVSGYRLAETPEFNDIKLRGGIIGNDALTSPVVAQTVYDSLTSFGLSTTMANIRTKSVAVPAGMTKAAVSIVVRVFATNPNTTGGYDSLGGDYLYGQANINGFNGYALPLAVSGNGGTGTNNSPFSAVLGPTELAGGFVTMQIAAQTAFANWAANANNVAEISGSIQWYR